MRARVFSAAYVIVSRPLAKSECAGNFSVCAYSYCVAGKVCEWFRTCTSVCVSCMYVNGIDVEARGLFGRALNGTCGVTLLSLSPSSDFNRDVDLLRFGQVSLTTVPTCKANNLIVIRGMCEVSFLCVITDKLNNYDAVRSSKSQRLKLCVSRLGESFMSNYVCVCVCVCHSSLSTSPLLPHPPLLTGKF